MAYYFIEPEVAGGFGDCTVIDRSSNQFIVKKLHYQFDGWLGDALLESVPCFIATKRLAQEIAEEHLTGTKFDDVMITKSDEFQELYPDLQLPEFIWLKIDGIPGKSDFGITPGLNLIVSEKALQLLKRIGISNAASITEFL